MVGPAAGWQMNVKFGCRHVLWFGHSGKPSVLRWGDSFYSRYVHWSFLTVRMKKLFGSVNRNQRYHKNKSGWVFLVHNVDNEISEYSFESIQYNSTTQWSLTFLKFKTVEVFTFFTKKYTEIALLDTELPVLKFKCLVNNYNVENVSTTLQMKAD